MRLILRWLSSLYLALIFGIHSELLGREFAERANYRRGAAGRVFVEIEANLVGATFRGRFVGAAIENGLADGKLVSHRRTSMALA